MQHAFIKKACSLDFLPPLIKKVRDEKKNKNVVQKVEEESEESEPDEGDDEFI